MKVNTHFEIFQFLFFQVFAHFAKEVEREAEIDDFKENDDYSESTNVT